MSEANHKNIVVVGAGIIGTSVATMLSKVSLTGISICLKD